MSLRPKPYSALMLSLIAALAITIGIPSNAVAQTDQSWTTVGSAGTVDLAGIALTALDGPTATYIGFLRGGIAIRYNVVAVDGLIGNRGIDMRVRYRATPDAVLAGGGADSSVIARLIEVNLFTGVSTTKLTLDSNTFPPSNSFQTQSVNTCPNGFDFDFATNAYYVQVQLGKRSIIGGSPAIQGVRIAAGPCLF